MGEKKNIKQILMNVPRKYLSSATENDTKIMLTHGSFR